MIFVSAPVQSVAQNAQQADRAGSMIEPRTDSGTESELVHALPGTLYFALAFCVVIK